MTHRQQTSRQFDSSRTCVEVSKVALESRDGNCFSNHSERRVISAGFGNVITPRSLTVSVDVTQVAWSQIRLAQRTLNGAGQAESTGSIGRITPIASGTNPEDLAVNRCTAADRMFVAFENERGSPFSRDRAVTMQVKRAACFRRCLTTRKAFVEVQSSNFERMNVRAAGTNDHGVSRTTLNRPDTLC